MRIAVDNPMRGGQFARIALQPEQFATLRQWVLAQGREKQMMKCKPEGELPYHPGYGLADVTREAILKDAAETSVQEAAKKHNVVRGTIYRWRAALAEG